MDYKSICIIVPIFCLEAHFGPSSGKQIQSSAQSFCLGEKIEIEVKKIEIEVAGRHSAKFQRGGNYVERALEI